VLILVLVPSLTPCYYSAYVGASSIEDCVCDEEGFILTKMGTGADADYACVPKDPCLPNPCGPNSICLTQQRVPPSSPWSYDPFEVINAAT
jgi:hypothetical protein